MKTTLLLLLATLGLCALEFPAPCNSESDPSRPLSASDAAAKMCLPPGFEATVFAAEPDVQNPIAMAWEARGSLWAAENYTYAKSGLVAYLIYQSQVPMPASDKARSK